jgi:hypothetical protein
MPPSVTQSREPAAWQPHGPWLGATGWASDFVPNGPTRRLHESSSGSGTTACPPLDARHGPTTTLTFHQPLVPTSQPSGATDQGGRTLGGQGSWQNDRRGGKNEGLPAREIPANFMFEEAFVSLLQPELADIFVPRALQESRTGKQTKSLFKQGLGYVLYSHFSPARLTRPGLRTSSGVDTITQSQRTRRI